MTIDKLFKYIAERAVNEKQYINTFFGSRLC
jgi:hypothetical protein